MIPPTRIAPRTLKYMGSCARFDDLTAGAERSFALSGLRDTVVARELDDVVPALREVERRTAEGLWAGGFVAYEAAPAFSDQLDVAPRNDDRLGGLPLVWFGLYTERTVVEPFAPRATQPGPYSVSAWRPEIKRGDYEDALATIQRHIAAGDTEQLNYSFRLHAAFAGDPSELYRDLLLAQRGANGACFEAGRFHIVSASPESFFRLTDERLEVRPMKGTARRGRWAAEDEAQSIRLLGSDQERAQNLRVVQAIAESMGAIAAPGSVRVEEVLELERLETVWQLTSLISAVPREATTIVDAFTALFPLCSITGTPRRRTMEIIAQVEPSPRGIYCGAIGYVAPPGFDGPRADFNVAIRTVAIDLDEGLAEYGVGGGITWDSDSNDEYDEARSKAQLLAERRPEFELWETLRWEPTEGFWLLEEHLERVAASADYFGYTWDREEAVAALNEAVAGCEGTCAVRLSVARNGPLEAHVLGGEMAKLWDRDSGPTVQVGIAANPMPSTNVFLFHQTNRSQVYADRARASLPIPADDVVLVNERGEVTQAALSNVAALIDGRWCTPPIDSGCRAGVYRASLIEKGMLEVRPVTIEEFTGATEIALLSSVTGWQRARLVAG